MLFVVNHKTVTGTNITFCKANWRPDYTLALEEMGPVTLSDGFSKAVCGSYRNLLLIYKRSTSDVERTGCFVRERTNSRVRMKRCAAAVLRSTKRVSVQESTESSVRQGLFRNPAPEADDQPPYIGIQLLQAPIFAASSAVGDNNKSYHHIVKVSSLPSNNIAIYS